MKSRRIIKGVLFNFLGTYTSRYSDYDGYWLFGFLVKNIQNTRFDLMHLTEDTSDKSPIAFAKRQAAILFREQIKKADLSMTFLREAYLEIIKLPEECQGLINGHVCFGFKLKFISKATTDFGKAYEREVSIFVAPHNPKLEFQSTRVTIF